MLWNEIKALWRSRDLVWVLTKREIHARHAGSLAGAVWLYLPPLLTVGAYYLVFDIVFSMRLGDQAPVRSAGIYLIVGSLPWMAFCDAITRGTSSLIDAGGLLQKNPLPPVMPYHRTAMPRHAPQSAQIRHGRQQPRLFARVLRLTDRCRQPFQGCNRMA